MKPDHRKLGEQLDLFSFHDVAPGTPFWHPNGLIIIKELEQFIRQLQKERGYLETTTPLLVKKKLYETSGHWEHYRENIFPLELEEKKFSSRHFAGAREIEKETFAIKPMNCPESTFIYSSRIRSYKDLPLRLSEFGHLYRRERTGVLTGLFRAYGFTMDDAHIYCRPNQIAKEVEETLKLALRIHKTFGLKTSFALATRPDKAMGDPKVWKKAENSLEYVLKKNKLKYEVRPKDGAFYGPKIDIDVKDSLQRKWTIATAQIDFQMPERFKLSYVDEKGKKQRPVIIHRSSIGSFERFIGILLEHYGGALPLWLSPEQIWIIPVASRHKKYAKKVAGQCNVERLRYIVKDENETVSKKIRDGETQKIPYILVVGDKEMKNKSVRVRQRAKGDIGEIKLNKFLDKVKKELETKK